MADLSFGVVGPTMNFSVTMKIADQDAPRILAYLASTEFGRVPDGDSVRDATTEETAKAFAAGILQGLLDQTVRHERDKAMAAAAEQVQPIKAV
jgi:hypothetical protein